MQISTKFLRPVHLNFNLHPILRFLLLVALLQALIYTFLIPPWWHYDEPGHFEFAWQIVHFDHWPKEGEWDEAVRRQIAASMLKYGYYKVLNYKPDLSSNEPVFIGAAPQTTDYPLYYLIASLPLRFLSGVDFAIQNRAVRLVSVIMFLVTVWVTWKSLEEILPLGHPIQWMVTLFVALLPGFVDTMTSINDDVGAALAFSLFVWASLRIMRRGFSWRRFLGLLLTVLICFWTKNTTWPALGIAPVVLAFSLFRERAWWVFGGIATLGGVALLLFLLRLGDARFWYRVVTQDESVRLEYSDAPVGRYVFRLHYQMQTAPRIEQFVTVDQIRPLRTKQVTLGAWIWASEPVTIYFPFLRMAIYKADVSFSPTQLITVGTSPKFYSLTFEVPYEAEYGWLEIAPFSTSSGKEVSISGKEVSIYYDGLVLAEGTYIGLPQFQDPEARYGIWDGKPFQNLIRNGSAEKAWFWVNPSLSKWISSRNFPFNMDVFLASLQDWQKGGVYYRGAAYKLFITFWGHPARDKINLLGAPLTYKILEWITFMGIMGANLLLWRKARFVAWREIFVLGLMLVSIWGITLLRGGGGLHSHLYLFPWARYAFPAIIPTALLLVAGWYEFLRGVGKFLRLSEVQRYIIFISFLAILDLFAIFGIARYFYFKEGEEFVLFALTMLSFCRVRWLLERLQFVRTG